MTKGPYNKLCPYTVGLYIRTGDTVGHLRMGDNRTGDKFFGDI